MLAYAAVALIGFLPSYYGPLVTGDLRMSALSHIHGAAMSAWMLFVISQAALIAVRRPALHRKLGLGSIAFAIILMGLMVAATFQGQRTFASGAAPPQIAAEVLLLQINAVSLFALFYVWAIRERARPDMHKRLIVLCIVASLDAATGRMDFLPAFNEQAYGLQYALYTNLLLLPALAFDLFTLGRIHRAYLIGGAIMLGVQAVRALLWASPAWLDLSSAFGRALL